MVILVKRLWRASEIRYSSFIVYNVHLFAYFITSKLCDTDCMHFKIQWDMVICCISCCWQCSKLFLFHSWIRFIVATCIITNFPCLQNWRSHQTLPGKTRGPILHSWHSSVWKSSWPCWILQAISSLSQCKTALPSDQTGDWIPLRTGMYIHTHTHLCIVKRTSFQHRPRC